jgi:hypothetical protein
MVDLFRRRYTRHPGKEHEQRMVNGLTMQRSGAALQLAVQLLYLWGTTQPDAETSRK